MKCALIPHFVGGKPGAQRDETTGLRSHRLSVGSGEGAPWAVPSGGRAQESQVVMSQAVFWSERGTRRLWGVSWGSEIARSLSLGRSWLRNAGGGGVRNPGVLGCHQF